MVKDNGEYVAATGVLMFGAGMVAGAMIADSHHQHNHPVPYSFGWGARYDYHNGVATTGPGVSPMGHTPEAVHTWPTTRIPEPGLQPPGSTPPMGRQGELLHTITRRARAQVTLDRENHLHNNPPKCRGIRERQEKHLTVRSGPKFIRYFQKRRRT